jgi:hypothetical protein
MVFAKRSPQWRGLSVARRCSAQSYHGYLGYHVFNAGTEIGRKTLHHAGVRVRKMCENLYQRPEHGGQGSHGMTGLPLPAPPEPRRQPSTCAPSTAYLAPLGVAAICKNRAFRRNGFSLLTNWHTHNGPSTVAAGQRTRSADDMTRSNIALVVAAIAIAIVAFALLNNW